ncbi:glycosyltransferase family 4 protein [Limosilactobacillus reuteri]|uniref:glycosyltransferase family 4 protein n=1 Tax=Limosilactobacillus reuteri TaxID=1598 RepID=UPI000A2ED13D|nr:glycosyltransferase family 4 protein [Limosilactobacillus reuteri]MCC4388264.1 glycosyltransferase family 4 protein [Limosilactobacillus reuteri]MCC4393940.1 glycosyltransferase family 4 protein [Limosilactobacillus reuteri]OTA59775.1 hypothetical protein BHL93_07940 [Limosilactobacillus reuteri]OTA85315.1 hypothetical protein BHL84_09065 [Limosilactobacillus reuteri]
MKIGFVLPMPTTKIVGGYKVVYECANYLAQKGHDVTIFYNSDKGRNSKSLPPFIVYSLRQLICLKEPSWFRLLPEVKKVNLYSLDKKYFKDYDVVVATAAETAIFVNELSVKKKIYLIQDFEKDWQLSEEQLFKTYNYPDMTLVVVSKWLLKKISEHTNKEIHYIPNGINERVFRDYKQPRKKYSIAMLYHLDQRKGAEVGLNVIFKLKQKYPKLEVNLFGTPKRDASWPSWIKYTRFAKPEQVAQIMNSSSVFLCTSRFEGFGLTGLESLFCGCEFVTTDCGGVREYASEDNSIICEVDDVNGLVQGVSKIFENLEQKNGSTKELAIAFSRASANKKFAQLVES